MTVPIQRVAIGTVLEEPANLARVNGIEPANAFALEGK